MILGVAYPGTESRWTYNDNLLVDEVLVLLGD
jgi:hypothetical protein